MAHYPFYTHNLSLVGVCVKRIGMELTSDIQGKSDNDLSLPGSATSLFQAMQQASMMASVLLKSRSERNRSRK